VFIALKTESDKFAMNVVMKVYVDANIKAVKKYKRWSAPSVRVVRVEACLVFR
jgi:hypothetical protein